MTDRLALPASIPIESAHDEQYLVTTRDGITFDSRDAKWPVSTKRTANIGRVREAFDGGLLGGLNGTLRSLASKHGPETMASTVNSLLHFHKSMFLDGQVTRWHIADLRNYRAKLVTELGCEDYLIRLRTFLKHWKALRHAGLSSSTVDALTEMRLKAAATGEAVRTLDSEKGPLSPEELHQLTLDVYKAAEDGRVGVEDLSLMVFHIVTGRRPGQSAALKCKDVDCSRKSDPAPGQAKGEQLLLLHVPRAKQYGHRFRQTRRSIHLIEVYFALFEAQRGLAQARLREMLSAHGLELQERDLEQLLDDLPLYPRWGDVQRTVDSAAEQRGQSHALALETLRVHAQGQYWHLSTQDVTSRLQKVCRTAGAKAASGEALAIGGTRLRYTKGTDLARQGVGLAALAWLLDHSNLHSAGIYVDNLPEHAAQVSEALAGSGVLNRVASLFRGELVDSEADAVGDNDPQHSRIHYKGRGTATCGKNKQCGLGGGIPLACYTCDLFKPWLDGPHKEVLRDLVGERKRNAETLGESHPVTLRRDKTIAAVTIVVQRCEARKRELESQKAEGAPNE